MEVTSIWTSVLNWLLATLGRLVVLHELASCSEMIRAWHMLRASNNHSQGVLFFFPISELAVNSSKKKSTHSPNCLLHPHSCLCCQSKPFQRHIKKNIPPPPRLRSEWSSLYFPLNPRTVCHLFHAVKHFWPWEARAHPSSSASAADLESCCHL